MKEWKIEQLTHSYGIKTLFDDLSFSIREAQRVGLIGVNGTGKTSLIRIVAGELKPDKGLISKPGEYEIGYLSQKSELDEEKTLFDTVFDGDSPVVQAARHYEEVLQKLSEDPMNPKIQQAFTEAEKRMNQEDAWTVSSRAKSILNQLGLSDSSKKSQYFIRWSEKKERPLLKFLFKNLIC